MSGKTDLVLLAADLGNLIQDLRLAGCLVAKTLESNPNPDLDLVMDILNYWTPAWIGLCVDEVSVELNTKYFKRRLRDQNKFKR